MRSLIALRWRANLHSNLHQTYISNFIQDVAHIQGLLQSLSTSSFRTSHLIAFHISSSMLCIGNAQPNESHNDRAKTAKYAIKSKYKADRFNHCPRKEMDSPTDEVARVHHYCRHKNMGSSWDDHTFLLML